MDAEAVLEFWFGSPSDPHFGKQRPQWWQRSAEFDQEVAVRFRDVHGALVRGEHTDWLATPRGALAYVIVLDQFSRNLFRDDPRAFDADALARRAATTALDRGFDGNLGFIERSFIYMPFMHSEDLEDQNRSVSLFEQLKRDNPETDWVKYAVQHRVIIERFGRFPHRNRVLARESTPEEVEFLKGSNSSF